MRRTVYFTDRFQQDVAALTIPEGATMDDAADEFGRALQRAYEVGRKHEREAAGLAMSKLTRLIKSDSLAGFIDA